MKRRIILLLALMVVLTGCSKKGTAVKPLMIEQNQNNFVWELNQDGDAVIQEYIGEAYLDVVVPETFIGYTDRSKGFVNDGKAHKVVGIEQWGDVDVLTLALPDTVQFIHDMPKGYYGEEFTLPAQLTEIGDKAFSDFGYTGQVIFPEGLESIGTGAFARARISGMCALPHSLKSVGEGVFEDCANLEGVVIPEEMRGIPANLFKGCIRLRGDLNIPEGVVEISEGAFAGCPNLTGLSLPSTLKEIGNEAFAGLQGVQTEMLLPNGLCAIGENAFGVYKVNDGVYVCGFKGLVTVPATVKDIAENAFNGCPYLDGVGIQNPYVDAETIVNNWQTAKAALLPEKEEGQQQ